MYTGIVQAMLPIASLTRKPGLTTLSIELPDNLMAGLELGASVALNGCCLTVTTIVGNEVTFDVIAESLALTNLKELEVGSMVNVERSARGDAEIGGHVLSGHVAGTAKIVDVKRSENNRRLRFMGNPAWMQYVFDKGFLALNGCSLTVAGVDAAEGTFDVNLIPETLARTNFALLDVGDEVNVEIDHQTRVIVETVERLMAARFAETA